MFSTPELDMSKKYNIIHNLCIIVLGEAGRGTIQLCKTHSERSKSKTYISAFSGMIELFGIRFDVCNTNLTGITFTKTKKNLMENMSKNKIMDLSPLMVKHAACDHMDMQVIL